MNPARPRGRLGPFIIGVLIGLIGGVLLVWVGIVPNLPMGGPAPMGAAPPPVAKDGKTTPAEADTEYSAKSAQPQAELACLERKARVAEGRDAVQRLAQEEMKNGAPNPLNDPDYFIQVLRARGYSCSDAEIEASAGKLEQKQAK